MKMEDGDLRFQNLSKKERKEILERLQSDPAFQFFKKRLDKQWEESRAKFRKNLTIILESLVNVWFVFTCLFSMLFVSYAGVKLGVSDFLVAFINLGLLVLLMRASYDYFKLYEDVGKKKEPVLHSPGESS